MAFFLKVFFASLLYARTLDSSTHCRYLLIFIEWMLVYLNEIINLQHRLTDYHETWLICVSGVTWVRAARDRI